MEKIIRIARGDLSVLKSLKYRGNSLIDSQGLELLDALLVFINHKKSNNRGKIFQNSRDLKNLAILYYFNMKRMYF